MQLVSPEHVSVQPESADVLHSTTFQPLLLQTSKLDISGWDVFWALSSVFFANHRDQVLA